MTFGAEWCFFMGASSFALGVAITLAAYGRWRPALRGTYRHPAPMTREEFESTADYGYEQALLGVEQWLEKRLERVHAAGQKPAAAVVNVSELILFLREHRDQPTQFVAATAEGRVVRAGARDLAITFEAAIPEAFKNGELVRVTWIRAQGNGPGAR